MKAEFICSNKELLSLADDLPIPAGWDPPNDNQMMGTPAEQLIELAGRGCYDSLGKSGSRSSPDYHEHLLGSFHWSVHEHVHIPIAVQLDPIVWLGVPDVYLRPDPDARRIRCTFNIRHALDAASGKLWREPGFAPKTTRLQWENVIYGAVMAWCPSISWPWEDRDSSAYYHRNLHEYQVPWWIVQPESPSEIFITMFLEDSRVWSHEMVRHRANISQRSGRFCDETDRELLKHPLLLQYLNDEATPRHMASITQQTINDYEEASSKLYDAIVTCLQDYAIKRAVDKLTARKQARSAARYYLGNGISTEMIFTASLHHWREIFRQRTAPAADAAIRELMCMAMEKMRENGLS